jgi:flavodoxin
MKTLIVYYSRTGTNKKIAKSLQQNLGADIEEIIDKKNRKGFFGLISGGLDVAGQKLTQIEPEKIDPTSYDLVILVSPIWGGIITPALRSYIKKNKVKFKKIAFCSVSGGGPDNKKAISNLEEACGKKMIASLLIKKQDVMVNKYQERLTKFAKEITKA